MAIDYPVIDLHSHLRNEIYMHTRIAAESGIHTVVYMANTDPVMDNVDIIKASLEKKRNCQALPVSAITKNLEGKELVNVDAIRDYVVGFSDDGKTLNSLSLLEKALEKYVLVMLHCEPETAMVEAYISLQARVKGKMHLQHISRQETIELIRDAKRSGVGITCETCPHYFTYTKFDLETKVNPPLALEQDVKAVMQGLKDGTIDAIANDYAPEPRKTGIAGFRPLIPLSYGLVLGGILTEQQLKEKLYLNPKKIIEKSGHELKI